MPFELAQPLVPPFTHCFNPLIQFYKNWTGPIEESVDVFGKYRNLTRVCLFIMGIHEETMREQWKKSRSVLGYYLLMCKKLMFLLDGSYKGRDTLPIGLHSSSRAAAAGFSWSCRVCLFPYMT